jgi:chemotaxis protein MotB
MRRSILVQVLVLGLAAPVWAQEAPVEDADVAEVEDLMAEVQARVDAIGKAAAERDEALLFLTRQVEQAMQNMAGQEDQNTSLQQKNAELNWEVEALAETRVDLNEQLSSLATEHDVAVAELQAQVASLADLLTLERESNASLEAEVGKLSSELDETLRDREEMTQALAEARRTMDDGDGTIATQEEEIAKLNQQLAALRGDLDTVTGALVSSEERVAQQNTKLAELDERLTLALAGSATELVQYRSEFFGRLRQALGVHPDIRIVGDRFVFQSEVLFRSGSAELGESGKEQLLRLAGTLKDISQDIPGDVDWILRVDGHTDRQAIMTFQYPSNWELSTARAVSVVHFLMDQGLPPNRLAATGFGEFQPIDPGGDEIAFRRNRRIEFKLTQK